MKNFFIAGLLTLATGTAISQSPDWVEQMKDPNVNFYTVQQNFEDYWAEREMEKGKGWKQFKRWEAFMEPRVFPTGERPDPGVLAEAWQQYQATFAANNSGNWTPWGPYDGNSLNGIGRVNTLEFDPTNSQIIWAGTPAGGLWKSTDGGQNWTTNTDMLTNLGVSDIVIDPTNSSIMYIATGDKDGADTYSFGVLKSTDGGQTWKPTGLSYGVNQQRRILNLYINPQNPQILIASTRIGVYRTTNGGKNWTLVLSGNYNSLVQKPNDPNILYLSSTSRLYKSTNNGVSWNPIPTSHGLPSSGISRIELAVTPDDPAYVYALYGASNNGFLGIYRSEDEGITWSLRADSPNLMGWSVDGSDNGGQAWYDLAIAVDPDDRDRLYVGGVNIWRSLDGGQNWQIAAHWYGADGTPYVHADIHHLIYHPTTKQLFTGCDGGVYRRNSTGNWAELNDGMNITQYYRIGASVSDTTLVIAGAQDNGTHLHDNNDWDRVRGGDGMECAIDPQNPNTMYSSLYYGDFRKSNDRGNDFNATFNLPPAGSGNWVTPFMLDPKHPDTIYAGFDQVYRSFDGGVSFNAVSPVRLTRGRNIDQMAISESNTEVIYISEGSNFYRSDDYGSTFQNFSQNLQGSGAISYISVDPNDPMHVIVSRSGYSGNSKVYRSRNGGVSWENLSSNLPNVPANCVIMENNTANGIYVGTDLGVFYTDDNMSQWVPYSANLPNVIVNELEITYADRKLKAATYGRGLWVSPLYGDLVAPAADFTVPSAVCTGDTTVIADHSSYHPDNWTWDIQPSTYTFVNGTDQNSQNPEVTFTQKGVYNITLIVSNENGIDSTHRISAIAVGGLPLPWSEDFESANSLDKWENGTADHKPWARVSTGGNSPGSNSIRAEMYFVGDDYSITSPTLNFQSYDSIGLSFDHSYRGRAGNVNDTLRVFIATNCSDNWILVKEFVDDGNNSFITNIPIIQNFTPSTTNDWCGSPAFAHCKVVDLSAYGGEEGVRLRFETASATGNNIILDNIFINGTPNAAPVAGFSANKTHCALRQIQFQDQSFGSPAIYEWFFPGGTPPVSNQKSPTVTYNAAGNYSVSLKVTNPLGTDSLYKSNYITILPADSVELNISASAMPLCTNDSLHISTTGVNEGINPIYNWYLNGNLVQSGNSGDHSFSSLTNGDEIYVSLSSSESCAFPPTVWSDTIVADVFPIENLQFHNIPDKCISDSSVSLIGSPTGGIFSGPGISGNTFDPAAAGAGQHILNYSYIDSNGCPYNISQQVVVDLPSPILFSNPVQHCMADGKLLLNMALPSGGTYSGPGVAFNNFYPDSVGPGTYTIYYTYATGNCPAVIDSSTITVLAGPSVPTVLYQNGILESSIAAASYQWYLNSVILIGDTLRTLQPTTNGGYTVEVFDSAGCSEVSATFSVGNVSLREINQNVSMQLFPNPAGDHLTVKLLSTSKVNAHIIISNAIGMQMMKIDLASSKDIETQLDISGLPSGLYILSLNGEDVKINRRFVKR